MTGTLYICATPIGNLEDITLRALRILKEVDLIAAEDTRHTIKLLNHYEIKNKLTSYHEHNRHPKGAILVERLKRGESIALVTDAGTPCVSDPGCDIVNLCHNEDIPVVIIPGPSALTAALAISGVNAYTFTFYGFLPRTNKKRQTAIQQIKNDPGAAIIYESPYRVAATLARLAEAMPERNACITREMTKIHEEVKRATLAELTAYYTEHTPRGEFVIIIN